jgi:imidazolonepropionase-like amidohydrolase
MAWLGLILAAVACRAAPGEDARSPLVIRDVQVVNCQTGAVTPETTIVVEGDRITHVGAPPVTLPRGARVLHGAGSWVIPGLVDVHVHDGTEEYLRDLLAWGVTSIHLMPHAAIVDPTALQRTSEDGLAHLPRIQLSEMFAGDFPDNLFPGAYEFRKPVTVDEASEAVRESYARGYRQIKIIRDDSEQWSGEAYRVPLLAREVYDALVAEARALDMRVYVHATRSEVADVALAAGLDAFLHGVMDAELGAEDWRRMAEAGTAWVPTFNALYCFGDQRAYARRVLAGDRFRALLDEAERAQWSGMAESEQPIVLPPTAHLVENTEAYVAVSASNTRHALRAGIPVAVGTDGGPAGISTHLELELLRDAGLSSTEVLTAATRGGAIALGRGDELGSIEVGRLADLILLSADPTADVRNCRAIEVVVKGGEVHRPAHLALEEGHP